MSKYELFESTANYAKHFADNNALYITVNSNNSMSADDLDKYIKRWFTSVEIAVFGEKKRKSNMRKHRVERLVAIHTQTTKAHAHILVNAKCCSPSALKRILKFAWLDMCDAHTESDFVFHCELLRDRESSGRYNNKELLSQHEHNSFNSLSNISTFILKGTQQQIYKHSMKKQRELVEAKLGRSLDDKVWNLVEKKQRSQQLAAKNELRTKRRIANAKNERKRLTLKQNNLATCDVRQATPNAVSKQKA